MSFTGVVVALRMEACSLAARATTEQDRLDAGIRTRIHVAGIGAERAAAGARALVERGASALVSWGTAGALDSRLSRGDLLLPEAVIDGERIFTTDARWRGILLASLDDLHPCLGTLLQSGQILRTAEAKSRARRTTGASAADMESGAIGGVAAAAGLPFLAIRAIVDRASDPMPITFDAGDRWRAVAVLRAIASRPSDIATLLSLSAGFGAAHRTLSRVATRLGAGLGAPV